jgi:hypothetical protein
MFDANFENKQQNSARYSSPTQNYDNQTRVPSHLARARTTQKHRQRILEKTPDLHFQIKEGIGLLVSLAYIINTKPTLIINFKN